MLERTQRAGGPAGSARRGGGEGSQPPFGQSTERFGSDAISTAWARCSSARSAWGGPVGRRPHDCPLPVIPRAASHPSSRRSSFSYPRRVWIQGPWWTECQGDVVVGEGRRCSRPAGRLPSQRPETWGGAGGGTSSRCAPQPGVGPFGPGSGLGVTSHQRATRRGPVARPGARARPAGCAVDGDGAVDSRAPVPEGSSPWTPRAPAHSPLDSRAGRPMVAMTSGHGAAAHTTHSAD